MRLSATLVLLLLLLSSNLILAQSSANAIENVNLPMNCSFALTMHSQPVYQKLQNITIYYTLSEKVPSCTIDLMNGSMVITQLPSSNIILSKNLTASIVNSTPQTALVSFNSDNLTNSTYAATVAFRFNGFSNSSTADFTLLNPQNLSIIGISEPFVAVRGAPITFQINTTNLGQLSAGNFTLFLNITGLTSSFAVRAQYPGASLLPFQNTTYTITLPNVTPSLGGYDIQAFDTYPLGNGTATSNIATTRYSVIAQTGVGGGVFPQSANYITSLPSLLITSAPLITSITSGTQSLSILGLQNTGTSPENVTLSIPPAYQDLLELSTNSLYLLQGQQGSVHFTFFPNATLPSGVYILPLKLGLSTGGPIVNQTEYFAFNLYSASNSSAQIASQLTLQNNTDTAQGTIQISNPTSGLLTNLTLQTFIPKALVSNISDIKTLGLQANIVDIPGFYMVIWQIPQISPLTSVYGYYTIGQPQSQRLLQSIKNVLATQASSLPPGILKVVNIAFPTFYTNSSGTISMFAVYTAAESEPISFILTGPPGITISNPSQLINSSQSQLLNPSFTVTPGLISGTYNLTLFVSTKGFNATYSLPIVVLPSAQSPNAQLSSLLNSAINSLKNNLQTVEYVLAAVAGLVAIYLIVRFVKMPFYRRGTSEQLARLRDQVKSEDSARAAKGTKAKKNLKAKRPIKRGK